MPVCRGRPAGPARATIRARNTAAVASPTVSHPIGGMSRRRFTSLVIGPP